MLTLIQFSPGLGLPNLSPFCMKVEVYLRMVGLPYTTKVGDPRKSPKGKFPVLKDGDKTIADSRFILAYLKKNFGDPLDQNLTEEQKVLGIFLTRFLEENLYWHGLFWRWSVDEAFQTFEPVFFGRLKGLQRRIIPTLARKMMMKKLHAQGFGRHTPEELEAMAKEDLAALSFFLGDKPFFLGKEPSSVDATAYAFLANTIDVPIDSPIKTMALQHPNFSAYCQRMREKYF